MENTIGEIEAKIHGSGSISDERKQELLQLLGTLKSEVGNARQRRGNTEQASSIANLRMCLRARSHEKNKQIQESLELLAIAGLMPVGGWV